QAPDVEELVLDPTKIQLQLLGRTDDGHCFLVHRPHQPDRGIQFIYRAVGLDPKAVFGNLLPAGQPRLSPVTGSRIDLRNSPRSSSPRFRERWRPQRALDDPLKTHRAQIIMK